MNAHISTTYLAPRPVLVGVERRVPIATLRDDSLFQGWGPKL
jgi:hypothetical protein